MNLTTIATTMLLIEDLMQPPHNLDPIRVITENFAARPRPHHHHLLGCSLGGLLGQNER